MKIKEVYEKYYYPDLENEFNYPESNEGYNQALSIVIGAENKSLDETLAILDRQQGVMLNWPDHSGWNEIQRWRFNCGWEYVSKNFPSAKKIADEDLIPHFISLQS